MTEHAPDRLLSGIDIPKTIAGVLAAVSAAVIGSFLGVAGTLIGAAVASLIGSVGTEVYHRSIDRGRKKIQGTFMTAPAAVGTPPVAAAPEETASSSSSSASLSASSTASPSGSASASPSSLARKIRWRRVALVAGALFVLAMGTLTTAELLSGRSVADATRGETGDRSTLSSLFGGGSPDESDQPADTPATTPATTSPEDDGSATTPATTEPTGEATQPTEETTEPPATEPEPDAPAGEGAPDNRGADTQNPDDGTE